MERNWEDKVVVIAEDEQINYLFLKAVLKPTKAKIIWTKTGRETINICNTEKIDIVLMDIKMPDLNGLEATIEIKKTLPNLPIVAQTAYAMSDEREKSILAGCDDYIAKPISFRELLVKIKNTFKRMDEYTNPRSKADALTWLDLTLNKAKREVTINGEALQTTAKEFDLLQLFLQNINHAFSREQIIENVWGYDFYGDLRQVDHMIKRLRKKMLLAQAECQIETVWGYGYKIGGSA